MTKKGFGFCDVIFGWDSSDELYALKNESVDNLYTGWHSGFPDAKANIIPESGRINPFEENIPFFLAELSEDEVCPRGLLNKIINKMEDVGIRSKSAFEYEFFLMLNNISLYLFLSKFLSSPSFSLHPGCCPGPIRRRLC